MSEGSFEYGIAGWRAEVLPSIVRTPSPVGIGHTIIIDGTRYKVEGIEHEAVEHVHGGFSTVVNWSRLRLEAE